MTHNLDDDALFLAVEAVKAASYAAKYQAATALENWAKRIVKGCPPYYGAVGGLDMTEVELLLAAMPDLRDIDHLVEMVTSQLSLAWKAQHEHQADIPWKVVPYDVHGRNGQHGITVHQKEPVS